MEPAKNHNERPLSLSRSIELILGYIQVVAVPAAVILFARSVELMSMCGLFRSCVQSGFFERNQSDEPNQPNLICRTGRRPWQLL